MAKNKKGDKVFDNLPVEGANIACPWHAFKLDHPKGAPPCFTDPRDLRKKVVNIGQVIFWMVMMSTEIAQTLPKVLNHVGVLELSVKNQKVALEQLEARIDHMDKMLTGGS